MKVLAWVLVVFMFGWGIISASYALTIKHDTCNSCEGNMCSMVNCKDYPTLYESLNSGRLNLLTVGYRSFKESPKWFIESFQLDNK